MPRHHGHHHHGAGHHHHGVGHHHHGIGHHHHGIAAHHHHHHGAGHNIHHHTRVTSVGTPMGAAGGPGIVAPAGNLLGFAVCLGMFGFFFLFAGIMMMSFGYSFTIGIGIVGTIFFIVGVSLLVACAVFCRRNRQQQQQTIVNQQSGGVTTLVYGQAGAQPVIVQPQQPGVPMAYGQPGVPPIVQPQAPGATILYGPAGEVVYQPEAQPGYQPGPQPYPAAVPNPLQSPEAALPQPTPSDPAAPPPTYEDAVNPAKPAEYEKDTAIVE